MALVRRIGGRSRAETLVPAERGTNFLHSRLACACPVGVSVGGQVILPGIFYKVSS